LIPPNLIHGVRLAAIFGTVSVGASLVAWSGMAAPPATRPVEGLRDNTPQIYALTNARIIVAPGQVIEKGTVVVRGDVIEAVGADVVPPADARTLDLAGRTIYPGLIDAYSEVSIGDDDARSGAPSWNPHVLPQRRVAARYQADAKLNEKLRSQGITLRLAVPSGGIIKGTSSLVTTGDESNDQALVKNDVAQHLRLTVSRGARDQYPNSPMGAVALARQTLYDAQWYRDAWRTWRANPNVPRPETNDALAALENLADERGLVIFDAINELFAMRADQFAREFALNTVLRGSGREYRRLDAIQQTGRPVLVPVNFPKPPNVATPEAVRSASLDGLMHWDLAPENPARLRDAGVTIALCSHGLDDVGGFLKSVRRAVERGLSVEDALRALTAAPAELFGMADRVGSVQRGRLANLVVVDGDLFDEKTKVQETWVLGKRFQLTSDPLFDLRGEWRLTLSPKPKAGGDWAVTLTGKPDSLEGTIAARKPKKGDEPLKLKHVGLRDSRFGASFDAQRFGYEGLAQLSVVVEASDEGELHWLGQVVWPDHARHHRLPLAHGDRRRRQRRRRRRSRPKSASATFIDANDINIYRQLAGGVTTANILHGSANPIGGQNQVIKLRWGRCRRNEIHRSAAGIKFALGENVKQSNWGEPLTRRYPANADGRRADHARCVRGRSAVRASRGRNGRTVARGCRRARSGTGCDCRNRRRRAVDPLPQLPPGRDPGAAAHAGDLPSRSARCSTSWKATRWPTRWPARRDGSSFSDWWAYKFEVFDAIPYNGALMHNAGRRRVLQFGRPEWLGTEPRGGQGGQVRRRVGRGAEVRHAQPGQAAAHRQYVGSLEPGKHADLVVWSGPPLSNFSRCEQTWVDGRKYFDREEDAGDRSGRSH
jgi:imidazolonepropionase-like amidohydrolase